MKIKKITSSIMAAAIAAVSMPVAVVMADAETTSPIEDFDYEVVDDNHIKIVGYKGAGGDIVLPSVAHGKKVINAYMGFDRKVNNTITSVVIPEGVWSFGFRNCKALKSVTIPNGVSYIPENAFLNCASLESITIPDSVNEIYGWAFYGCASLKSVDIPKSVTKIGNQAFQGCTSLKNVTIQGTDKPDVKTEVGIYAFAGCTGITDVTIGSGVSLIDGCAFDNCKNLDTITIYSRDCSIHSNDNPDYCAFPSGKQFKIYGYKNSTAEAYAQQHGNTFVTLEEPPRFDPNCELKIGDADGNGKVNSSDATAVLKHIIGLTELTGNAFANANANGDGKINSQDATYILKMVIGLI